MMSRELVMGSSVLKCDFDAGLFERARAPEVKVDRLKFSSQRIHHRKAHGDVPFCEFVHYQAGFGSVLNHQTVVEFIRQAKRGHNVIRPVGVVVD